MRASIWTDLAKLIAAFLLLWASFVYMPKAWLTNWFSDRKIASISIEQEEKLGEFLTKLYLSDQSLVNSAPIDSAMWVIQSRLLKHLDATSYQYKFHIVDNDMVNAMTFPGGNIMVFKGLIEFSETPEEVAAVLAHEIGHVQKRHVVDRLVTELGITFVLAVLTGGDATLMNEVVHTMLSGVFSRTQEEEADMFGLRLLENASIDPRSMAAFFRKLNREELAYNENLEWLMSHPHNNARIKASLEYPLPKSFSSQPLQVNWSKVKAAL